MRTTGTNDIGIEHLDSLTKKFNGKWSVYPYKLRVFKNEKTPIKNLVKNSRLCYKHFREDV